jgi:hypothetical protein
MIAEQTTVDIEQLRKQSHDRLKAMNESLIHLAEGNKHLKTESATYDCTGELDISALLVYTSVRVDDMRFSDGTNLKYDGSGFGVGLGATGKSIGAGTFNIPPSQLLNQQKVKMQVFFLAAGIGGVEVSFWDEHGSEYFGIFVAGSLGAGAGSFGGDGKFSRA